MKLNTTDEIRAFYLGKHYGIVLFAYWKDGEQYVGSCGHKLKDMLDELHIEEAKDLLNFTYGMDIERNE